MFGICDKRASNQLSYDFPLIQKIAAEPALKLVQIAESKNVILDSGKANVNLLSLIPKLIWKFVRDHVVHRHKCWGILDKRETRTNN